MCTQGAAPGCLLRGDKMCNYCCASPEKVAQHGGGGGGDLRHIFFFFNFKKISNKLSAWGRGTIMAMTARWADKQKKKKKRRRHCVHLLISRDSTRFLVSSLGVW